MRIPVLTYHSMHIDGNAYAENDHTALATDLQVIDALGFRVIPLSSVVQWHQGEREDVEVDRAVALTMDDGSWFDFYDLDHPVCGMQRSMFNILKDFQRERERGYRPVHATSFVICSPKARALLDEQCMVGKQWWGDEWWRGAIASGLMDIACHSWDHVHPSLPEVSQGNNIKGDFTAIETAGDCAAQVTRAGCYIEMVTGEKPSFFAYPWGQASDYMKFEFMPRNRETHGFRAAFSTEAKHVEKSDYLWNLPRYVCSQDWKSPTELERLLTRN